MGRPKVDPRAKKSRVLAAKLSPDEEESWDELRSALVGGASMLPRDTDALRRVIAESCAAYGVKWRGSDGATRATSPRPYPTPPEPKVLRVAERTGPGYGAATEEPAPGERFGEPDGPAAAPSAPAGKAKRPRR